MVSVPVSSVRSVSFSAFRAGSLSAVLLRPSPRACSGRVLVCSFSSPQRAGAFAAQWARRLGISVRVRILGGVWSVSIPVGIASSRLPVGAGRRWPVSGGLRGFLGVLSQSGLGACRV